jgi:molybdopterin-guanine dinucleotide biosynthesis adapter protein
VAARGAVRPPIVAVSGPSGSGKTRLLARLIPALAARGVSVAVLKHTGHVHPFDVPGKDTDVLRRAGAVAAVIQGPAGMAYFGPPRGGARALAKLLPPVDLVLAEGWKREPLPRVEVHRRSVSRDFLSATDRRVFAVVTDEPPPRPVPVFDADAEGPLADLICARFGISSPRRGKARLRGRADVRSVRAEGSERTDALGRADDMAKTTKRSSGNRGGARGGRRSGGARSQSRTTSRSRTSSRTGASSRSAAGRKGGSATLRARGPEFYSEIGRKGGRSRAKRAARARSGGRSTGGRSGSTTRRSGASSKTRSSSRGGRRSGR